MPAADTTSLAFQAYEALPAWGQLLFAISFPVFTGVLSIWLMRKGTQSGTGGNGQEELLEAIEGLKEEGRQEARRLQLERGIAALEKLAAIGSDQVRLLGDLDEGQKYTHKLLEDIRNGEELRGRGRPRS
jgi:hypothetical protein